MLLKDHLGQLQRVEIDIEYPGKDADIRASLLRLIWRKVPVFEPEKIVFRRVGRRSPADKKARAVREGKDQEYRTITLEELLGLIEQKTIGGSHSLREPMPGSHSRTGYREAPVATRPVREYSIEVDICQVQLPMYPKGSHCLMATGAGDRPALILLLSSQAPSSLARCSHA